MAVTVEINLTVVKMGGDRHDIVANFTVMIVEGKDHHGDNYFNCT